MAFVLSIANQKGGVGKTTTAINLAYNLSQKGFKTLLIDFDPQGNASSGLGIAKDFKHGIYDVLINDVNITDVIIPSGRKKLSICPTNINLAGGEVELVSIEQREYRLKLALESIKKDFDVVVIDCPPSLGLLTVNALTASDAVLIPVQGEYYALEGLSQLLETINLVNQGLNPNLKIFGVAVTMADLRTTLAQQVKDEIDAFFGEQAFKTIIPRNVRLSEAPSFGQAISEFSASSKGAWAYDELTKEVVRRIKRFSK